MGETLATIIGLITIFGPAITAIVFILKYRNDVNNLKKEVRSLKERLSRTSIVFDV